MVLETYILKLFKGARHVVWLIGLPLCGGFYLGLFLFSICVVWVLVYLMEIPPIKRDVLPSFFPSPMPLMKAL
jgi:hypothetical protein